MPVIYLSPSTQEWNAYVTGSGSEEYHMNQLADALVPYLWSNAIRYQRNRPDMTAASSIREGNAGDYDLYLALHSNAHRRAIMGKSVESSPSIIPAANRGKEPQNSLSRNCGRSIRCPIKSQPGRPPPWGKCASPGHRQCWWKSDTMIITQMPFG